MNNPLILQKYRMCLRHAQEKKQSTEFIFRTPFPSLQASHPDFSSLEINHFKYHTQNNLQYNTQNHLPYQTKNSIFSSYQSRLSLTNNLNFSNLGQNYFLGTGNQGSLRTPYPYISSPFSKTQNSTINTTQPFSNFYSNHPETSTNTLNFRQKYAVTFNNQYTPITPNTQNSPIFATNTSPLTNENPQPDFSNNNRYVGFGLAANRESVECGQTSAQNIHNSETDKENFLSEDNINEILAQFPSTEMDNNSEQVFHMPSDEFVVRDLLGEIGEICPSPDNISDLEQSLLDHTW